MTQDDHVEINRQAWNAQRYAAWVEAMGEPAAEAAKLRVDPDRPLRRVRGHLGDVAGKRVCNIQGSHGRLAVAMSLLGAEVTVVDFAEESRRYALELAAAAGVTIDYRAADVMEADGLGLGAFDVVLMELGILHYHHDLAAFFAVMANLLKPGGRLVLQEYHPVQRKLFSDYAGQLDGYFSDALVSAPVPDPTGQGRDLGTCIYRFWTLGEVLTALTGAGLSLQAFQEAPEPADPRVPGLFTAAAVRS